MSVAPLVLVATALISCILFWSANLPLSDKYQQLAFHREGSKSCVPAEERRSEPAPLERPLTQEELIAFQRDGVVVLRDMLSSTWKDRLQALVEDAFEHPNGWDVLYSRMVANFYSAQKSIMLHHTSVCGREIAESAPTTALAATLLNSSILRVCEPTEALGNFHSCVGDCGHTAWHRDDKYFPVERVDPTRANVVRFWIPVVDFTPKQLRFQALNNSLEKQAERAAAGMAIEGTDFAFHDRLEASGILKNHIIDGGELGLKRGDIVAFAGETPHIAQQIDCTEHRACLRLILSFSGDNSQYVSGRWTSLLPLHGNQTVGQAPQGQQFPQVFPSVEQDSWEWKPFRPTYYDVAQSVWFASVAGMKSFYGYDQKQAWDYIMRVARFSRDNVWDKPSVKFD